MNAGARGGMAAELGEAPEAVRRQALTLAAPLADLAARLRLRQPEVAVTCARGSSAHAATFAKHLIERHLGIAVAAAAPRSPPSIAGPCTFAASYFSPSRSRDRATI